MTPIAVVVPAYNEEKTIAQVIEEASRFGVVVVVNDCSVDQTAEIAKQAGIKVVSHEKNLGYDSALSTGVREALELGFQVIVTTDADAQFEPGALKKVIDEINRGSDVVVGVRPSFQRFGERVFGLVGKIFWGIDDPLCGMKAYRSEVFQRRGCFAEFSSVGADMAVWAARNSLRVTNVNVGVRPRADISRFGGGFLVNLRLIWVLFRLLNSH